MASETSSFLACSAHRPFHEKNLDEWDHALFLPSSVRPRQTRHFFSNGSFLPPPPCQSLSSSDVTLLALRCQSEWTLSFLRPPVAHPSVCHSRPRLNKSLVQNEPDIASAQKKSTSQSTGQNVPRSESSPRADGIGCSRDNANLTI